jgi:hypothetical protein
MSYYQNLITQAVAARASDSQVEFIKASQSRFGESYTDKKGFLIPGLDSILRRRLDSWLTALEVGYKPDEHWAAVQEQARRMCL